MIQLKKILHPSDFSEPSIQALKYAQALCARFQSELHLLHVVSSIPAVPLGTGAGFVPPNVVTSQDDFRENAGEQLGKLIDPDWAAEHSMVQATVEGSPTPGIIEYAQEHDIDLIVLGTHGRNALKQVLIGSVAERIVRQAPCPVLTVRPNGQQFVMP